MNKKITLLLVLSLFFQEFISAQKVIHHEFDLSWKAETPLQFDGAGEYAHNTALPVYVYRFPLEQSSRLHAGLIIETEEIVPAPPAAVLTSIPEEVLIGTSVEQERGKWYGRVWFMPFMQSSGQQVIRIKSGLIEIKVEPENNTPDTRSGPVFKESSLLADGVIHRIAVSREGIYRIDYNFIKDKLKLEPSAIDPDHIGVFGNGGGRVPQWNNAPRIDDLEQTATLGVGLEDGQFNSGDYLLWYAEGPDTWSYNRSERIYDMDKNIYDELNHYYIIIDGPARLSMTTRPSDPAGDYTSATSLVYQRLEEEKVNLLGRYRPPGSGQEWYGDELAVVNQLDYTSRFNLTDLVPSDTFYFKVRFAARSGVSSQFYAKFNQREFSRNVGGVDLVNYEVSFANDAVLPGKFVPGEPVQQIQVRYPSANGVSARAWLDYIQLNYWSQNIYRAGKPLYVRDPRSDYLGIPTYQVKNLPNGAQIWEVTDPLQPVRQEFQAGTEAVFTAGSNDDLPRTFVCFNPSQDVLVPEYEGEVVRQNLHSLQRADLLIVYYDAFESAAQKLANHRRSHSGLEVTAVPVSQIFEEFSGGSRDPSAIRDFARMMYTRDPEFKYLLLLGDATYDFLNHFPEIPYHNYVPAFETEESLDPIRSFPSDDYFALLDDDEGDNLIGAIDIAVGRMPVATTEEANALIDKIIHYDTHPATLNDWRMRVVMVADDEDSNIHLNQADELAVEKSQAHPELNIQKIYLDAFPQESTPGGDRYPAVNEAIDLHMRKGALTVTYMGHGGQNGWTQERVLGINQAQSYDNKDNMPLYITATCSFAGYDEPGFTTAGEHLLINPDGGAIGLMTTVRAVYSGSNKRLTEAVLKRIYTPDTPGEYPSIAEVLRRAKNDNALDTLDNNARKFTLLGDPSMILAHPRYGIAVTEIQGQPVVPNAPDTLSALEKATISGVILDDAGQVMTSFQGKIIVTLFDKVLVRKTLANDEKSIVRPFVTQTRQLFKGSATVHSGQWTIDFVMPKDIDFSFGSGKLSLYAHTDQTDAAGYFNGFIVGGVSTDGLADNTPPEIRLFMNDTNFVTGGITDRDPDIYMILRDDNGINVSGTSVGHDIEAILDGDERNSLILNDFYQAFQDDYTQGEVRYPLQDLAPGKHTLQVTAWDLANNPAEASLEFYVIDEAEGILKHLTNFPNPFSGSTYFKFEHNLPEATMELSIRIYNMSGQLVCTLEKEAFIPGGYNIAPIEWEGVNDAGAPLTSGMYIYNVTMTYNVNGNQQVLESDAEKLVIIR